MDETTVGGKTMRTLGEIARACGVSLRVADRIAYQYEDRLPKPERAGILRIYPADTVEVFASILKAERRTCRPAFGEDGA